MEQERLKVLNQVKAGEISIEEGARLLKRLENEPGGQQQDQFIQEPSFQAATPDEISEAGLKQYQNWWLYPLWVGLGILVFSAGLMSWGYSNGAYFWFYCSWLPLLLGLLVIVLSAWSRNARWLHVRVDEESEEKNTHINLSFPLPTGIAGWFLRTFGSSIPKLKDKQVTETILPLLDTLGSSREPMIVEVNDKEGEKVKVYII
jgi:hypothetical protein